MTNLQTLENEIRKALPELIQLKKMCVLKAGKVKFTIIDDYKSIIVDSDGYSYFYPTKANNTDFEVIGQEIQLIHVLKWLLQKEVKDFDFNLHSHSTTLGIGENNPFGVCYNWNLNENLLKNQSKELIDFLFNLIQK